MLRKDKNMKLKTVHFSDVISLNNSTISHDAAEYDPATDTISIDIDYIRSYFSCWKRQVIAIIVHELTHWYQWHFVYQHDTELWNDDTDYQETQADHMQDFVLRVLLV